MSELRFEWDAVKAPANSKKHGVSFEEARSVFSDERARLIDDPDHSREERALRPARARLLASAARGLSLP